MVKKETINHQTESKEHNEKDFIYVPSLELYVAKEKTHFRKNWFESHKLLQEQGNRMLIIPEFIEFLKYLKSQSNNQEYQNIYKNITGGKNYWKAEWLDADFKINPKLDFFREDNNILRLLIRYNHILDSNRNLIPKNLKYLDLNTLMKDKTPGINLEDFLNYSHTTQGLPTKEVKSGNNYYWYPRRDNNSVARFSSVNDKASLVCNGNPSYANSNLGVRAVKEKKN